MASTSAPTVPEVSTTTPLPSVQASVISTTTVLSEPAPQKPSQVETSSADFDVSQPEDTKSEELKKDGADSEVKHCGFVCSINLHTVGSVVVLGTKSRDKQLKV